LILNESEIQSLADEIGVVVNAATNRWLNKLSEIPYRADDLKDVASLIGKILNTKDKNRIIREYYSLASEFKFLKNYDADFYSVYYQRFLGKALKEKDEYMKMFYKKFLDLARKNKLFDSFDLNLIFVPKKKDLDKLLTSGRIKFKKLLKKYGLPDKVLDSYMRDFKVGIKGGLSLTIKPRPWRAPYRKGYLPIVKKEIPVEILEQWKSDIKHLKTSVNKFYLFPRLKDQEFQGLFEGINSHIAKRLRSLTEKEFKEMARYRILPEEKMEKALDFLIRNGLPNLSSYRRRLILEGKDIIKAIKQDKINDH